MSGSSGWSKVDLRWQSTAVGCSRILAGDVSLSEQGDMETSHIGEEPNKRCDSVESTDRWR